LIVATADDDARRVIEAAKGAAASLFSSGEARLLAAVSAFVEGSNLLREEMAKVAEQATSWRDTPPPPVASNRPAVDPRAATATTNGGRPNDSGTNGGPPSRLQHRPSPADLEAPAVPRPFFPSEPG